MSDSVGVGFSWCDSTRPQFLIVAGPRTSLFCPHCVCVTPEPLARRRVRAKMVAVIALRSMTTPAIPSAAATLVLLRDRQGSGVETLLIQRHSRSKFAAGDYVFAGGKIEADDIPGDVERF